jgi:hypothetical protein
MRIRLLALVGLLACSVDADSNATRTMPCTLGAVAACSCADGNPGTASCGLDGYFGACMCAAATEASTASETGATTDGSGAGETSDPPGGDSTAAGSSGCDGSIYAGKLDAKPSLWSMGGQTGLAAGALICGSIAADHVCDYEELKMAELAGELDGVVNFTAWIQRTTIESVDGTPSAASPGGRCVDWTTDVDTLADGEWVDFTEAGLVYHLDPDTFYDGLDGSHADPAALPCAATTRAILCCNAAC